LTIRNSAKLLPHLPLKLCPVYVEWEADLSHPAREIGQQLGQPTGQAHVVAAEPGSGEVFA
jgi:hypothetical protein